QQGHQVSDYVVRRLLKQLGYSLQANQKTTEGAQHPDRDEQFSYLNTAVADHMATGDPVISIDTKKKELVGNFKDPQLGKANPYGIYDVTTDTGWVTSGYRP